MAKPAANCRHNAALTHRERPLFRGMDLMPVLSQSKRALYDVFRRDVAIGGARLLLLSSPDEWPQIYSISRDGESARIRVYLWPLTYDITRRDHKYQVGGLPGHVFDFTDGVETVIMGYNADLRLYLAADADRRRGRFGKNVAIQVRQNELDRAAVEGFTAFEKVGGEIALVIRYEFLATYLLNVRQVHDLGKMPNAVEAIDRVAETRGADEDGAGGGDGALQERQRSLVTFARSVRASDFRKRVMLAYENQCAVCAVQLRLVQAAHIIPAGAEKSSDETCNGIALCALHHLAYDAGLLGIFEDFTIGINESMASNLAEQLLGGGVDAFKTNLRPSIVVPYNKNDQPRRDYLEAGLRQRGWTL